jgi:dihydrofolate reductase
MEGTEFSLVAAVAANGVVGDDGTVPWSYPADLAHFRRTTTGHPVVMGRRTYDDVARQAGGPLPDRRNVVLTSRPGALPDGVVGVDSVPAARAAAVEAAARMDVDVAYVVGGASVYEQFLPAADELLLSELDRAYPGDTTFPAVDWDAWRETSRDPHDGFDVVRYRRAAALDDRD